MRRVKRIEGKDGEEDMFPLHTLFKLHIRALACDLVKVHYSPCARCFCI